MAPSTNKLLVDFELPCKIFLHSTFYILIFDALELEVQLLWKDRDNGKCGGTAPTSVGDLLSSHQRYTMADSILLPQRHQILNWVIETIWRSIDIENHHHWRSDQAQYPITSSNIGLVESKQVLATDIFGNFLTATQNAAHQIYVLINQTI